MNEKQTVESETLRPTKKTKELLGYIEGFIAEHGYSPSYREIMAALNYTSVATVALHVGNLIKRGHLRKRDRSARSLEVVNPIGVTSKLPTNEIKASEEKWLVEQVERHFAEAEQASQPGSIAASAVSDLAILINALRVLGIDGAAQSFTARLGALQEQNH